MHKPLHSLIFTVALFGTFGLAGFFFPPGGITIAGKIALSFPSPRSLFSEPLEKADISEVLAAANKIDTTFRIDEPEEAVRDSSPAEVPAVKSLNRAIQHNGVAAMQKFYDALLAIKDNPSLIRVLHYGDSQIEGDRITDYLRARLQQQFGGAGPGLVSFVPLTSSPSVRVITSSNWDRYSHFTAKDARVPHKSYGVRASFCRYSPYRSITDTSTPRSAQVTIKTIDNGAETVAAYTRLRLYYGGSKKRTWCEFYDGPALVAADSLDRWGIFRFREYPVTGGSNEHTFRFRGLDSPDFYAVSLEGESGVMVDNIAMRGSSGTFFHHIDRAQMKQFYDHLNVKLIILQFGGNTLPAIEDSAMAANYAQYMRHQVSIVKALAPAASILFIGPSDMSVKDGTSYVTHPFLEPMRDHLRAAMLAAGCAFFDLYDVMGGRNSMPAWVDENLAGKDYTHFSPKGARKIATLLHAALMSDYNEYKRSLK